MRIGIPTHWDCLRLGGRPSGAEGASGTARSARRHPTRRRAAKGGVACRSSRTLVRIEEPLPYFITRLTGITDDMLLFDGDPIELALPRFAKFVGNLPVVFYNVSFDMSFLRAEAQRQGMRFANAPVARRFHSHPQSQIVRSESLRPP